MLAVFQFFFCRHKNIIICNSGHVHIRWTSVLFSSVCSNFDSKCYFTFPFYLLRFFHSALPRDVGKWRGGLLKACKTSAFLKKKKRVNYKEWINHYGYSLPTICVSLSSHFSSNDHLGFSFFQILRVFSSTDNFLSILLTLTTDGYFTSFMTSFLFHQVAILS